MSDDLMDSLSALSQLLYGPQTLEQTLVRVAGLAVHAIPGAEGAGLTLIEADRPQTVVATDAFVKEVDDVQYALSQGPCVSAVAEQVLVTSGNLGGDSRWPHFGPRVGRLGVHSALSMPLMIEDRALGAINVYAHAKNAFTTTSVDVAGAFAPHAAVSVRNAQLLAQAERVVAQLQQALTSRAQIDQALGVLMSRSGATAPEAFERLRAMSQTRSVKLAQVAAEVLGEARRRAQARHAGTAEPLAGPITAEPD